MRKFPRIRQLFFFIGENKTKKIHAKSVERIYILQNYTFVFRFKNPEIQ